MAEYTDEGVITFQTKEEAEAYILLHSLEDPNAFEYSGTVHTSFSATWLDDPANPKRDISMFYPVSGAIQGARGFLGSYVIDISSYDINNNIVNVKYRDKQGTGILTCDPSINNTLSNFETTVFPANDLLADTTNDVFNFTIESNQKSVTPGEDLAEILVKNDVDYTTSGEDKNNQPFIITFDNPYQIQITFNDKTAVGAFAFKTPQEESSYKNFMHQFAIYGYDGTTLIDGKPDYTNVKNNSDWVKLTGMQTFDAEIALNSYSDWVTTNIYDPESSKTVEEDVTLTKTIITDPESEYYEKTVYITTLIGDDYTYTVKADGITVPITDYTLDSNGILLFTNPENTPEEGATIVVYGTTYNWARYKFYVIEIYSVHDTSISNPSKVSFKQIKALYKDSLSTINYNNNNAVNVNVPLRIVGEDTKVICLPTNMEYYEYTVSLNGITNDNGYRAGDILKWINTIDGITYTFIINIIQISSTGNHYSISLQTENGIISSNLRGKSNLYITNDTLDATNSTTRGAGGTISITSNSTINLYGSYTGNFYTNADIQSADLPTLNKYNHFTTYIEFRQPLIKNVVIEANVEYENVTNYQTVRNNIIAAVNALFDLQPYSIGSSLNVSDIWKAINSVEGVKRFNVITPINNIDCLPYELLMLPAENLTINDIINSEYK